MHRNFLRIALSVAGLLITFLASNSHAAKSSRSSGGDGSPITVVIDAGHGGHDRGGIPGQRVAEKDMTLDVALRLRNILSANGYHVVMTRSTDVFVPLGGRVAIANSYRNAVFVCIHFNATGRSGASGIETYFYSRDSLALASAIHYYVAGGAPSENRGVRRRGYYVLRKTNIPAVLVECGFLTNPTEAAYAQTASYRQRLAEEIAAGVRRRNLRWERFRHDPSRDRRKHPATTVHGSNEGHQFQKEPLEAFAQEKRDERRKLHRNRPSSEARAASSDREG